MVRRGANRIFRERLVSLEGALKCVVLSNVFGFVEVEIAPGKHHGVGKKVLECVPDHRVNERGFGGAVEQVFGMREGAVAVTALELEEAATKWTTHNDPPRAMGMKATLGASWDIGHDKGAPDGKGQIDASLRNVETAASIGKRAECDGGVEGRAHV